MDTKQLLLATSALLLISLPALGGVLQNQHFRVVICEDWIDTHPPGSLLEFCDLEGTLGNILEDMDYAAKVNAGNYTLAPGIFDSISNSEAIFASPCMIFGGATLPVRVSFYYRLTDRGLNISWRVDSDAEVTFPSGMYCRWDLSPWQTLASFDQVGQSDSLQVPNIAGWHTRTLKSAWKFADNEKSLWMLQPDPLHGRCGYCSDTFLQVWLHSRPPKTTFPTSQFPQ